MNVKKCANGHFFDADKYQLCPHCGASLEQSAPPSATRSSDRNEHNAGKRKKDEAEAVVRHNKERDQGMGFLLPAFILRVVSEDIDFCIQIELPIRIDLLQVPRILTQFAVLPVVGGAGENSVLKVFLQVVVCLCRRPAVQSLV